MRYSATQSGSPRVTSMGKPMEMAVARVSLSTSATSQPSGSAGCGTRACASIARSPGGRCAATSAFISSSAASGTGPATASVRFACV